MAGHVMNCFEIQNADELRMNYRLVRVDGPFDPDLGDGDVAERNLQQLVKRMQYEEKIPVAIQRAGAQPILAVPMEHRLNRTEYDLAPDVAVLQPLETSGSIALSSTDRESEHIGMAFLGYTSAALSRQSFVVIWNVDVLQQTASQLHARRPRDRRLSRLRFSPRLGG